MTTILQRTVYLSDNTLYCYISSFRFGSSAMIARGTDTFSEWGRSETAFVSGWQVAVGQI